MAFDFSPENPNILFDLRQTYALKILEPILLIIENHRRNNEFKGWYEELTMSLYTNLYQKLTTSEREDYQKLLQNVNKELSKYPETFNGKDRTHEKVMQVKFILQDLEMWLKDKMEKAGIYGRGFVYDEDEI